MTQLKGITFLNTGLSDCNLLVPYCVPVPVSGWTAVTLVDDEFQ